ncbi:MAG: zinc-ribbon domain-containing protein [Methanomassiliicoccales archaeon]|nr:zinc-ribbon domain-containing protein [Methanomassiliicoccales archaeon]
MRYCPRCGGQVRQEARFCDQCGSSLTGPSMARKVRADSLSPKRLQAPPPRVSHSDPRIAAILALGPGFFGLMGLGHIYLNRLAKGLVILAVGVVLGVLTWIPIIGLLLLSPSDMGPGTDGEALVSAVGLFGSVFFLLWLWQTYDAYAIARKIQPSSDAVLPPPYY